MYARTTTLRGDPQAVDDGIANVRDEVMPMVRSMDGCTGLSMLVDRDTGRCIVTSAWQSEEAMRASAEAVRSSRSRAAEILRADPQVAEWEIALMHRVHEAGDSACTRVIWAQRTAAEGSMGPEDFVRDLLPRLEELPGFCSANLMVDRTTGQTAMTVTYESRDAMSRASERAGALREEFHRSTGMDITEVAEFDLVLAHLRVPETV